MDCSDNDLIPLSALLSRKKHTKLAKKKHASYNVCNFRNIHSKKAYTGRIASSKQTAEAVKQAEEVQKNLNSENPSCIKAMVHSNVSGAFWLCLLGSFKMNLPDGETIMILEGESGLDFNVKYIDRTIGLSGGWKRFAVAHKLELGDVLVFELTQPTRFKAAAKGCEAENNGDFQACNEAVTSWKRMPNCKRSKTRVQ